MQIWGRDSIRYIIQLSNDSQFLHALNSQLDEYEEAYDESGRLLRAQGVQAEDASPVAKAMSRVTSTMKSLVNPSTSKLAEMMIQGNTMGVTELKKQLNAYHGSNPAIVSLAKRQLNMARKNIEEMKNTCRNYRAGLWQYFSSLSIPPNRVGGD